MNTDSKNVSRPRALLKSVLRITGVLVALCVVAYLVYSVVYTNVPKSRLAVTEAVNTTEALRLQIGTSIQEHGSIEGVGTRIAPPVPINTKYGIVAISVSANGAIRMKSEKPVFDVEMVVSKDNSGIKWHCRGTPEESLPKVCRQ
jgi:hypothetical protein